MQDYWKWYATFLFFWDLVRSDAYLSLLIYFIVRSTTKNKFFMTMIWYSMTWNYPWGWVVTVVFLSTSSASFDDKFSILFAYTFNYAYGHAHSLIYLEWLINLFILFMSWFIHIYYAPFIYLITNMYHARVYWNYVHIIECL